MKNSHKKNQQFLIKIKTIILKRNILFISRWYPSRYDTMEGLFVQKHAHAVSLYHNVSVLFVYEHKDVKKFDVCATKYHDVNEFTVYYPSGKSGFFNKLIKPFRYIYAYYTGFSALKKHGFRPDLIHANVLTRTVLIAFFYKLITKTPYVITEHWTRLLPGRNGFNGFLRKTAAKIAIKNSACIMPVSNELLRGLEENKLLLTNYRIVENVVDDCFYKEHPKTKRDKIRLLNITCFLDVAKNISGLLRATRELSKLRNDFELILIGEGVDYEKIVTYYKSLKFENDSYIIFAGLKTSEEVAEMMQNADFLVQFSNYESAGVVVQEALVSGIPVVSTSVGIAPQYIDETNGLLVAPGDEYALKEAMNHVMNQIDSFDRNKIKQQAGGNFSYKNIGGKYSDIYNKIFRNKN